MTTAESLGPPSIAPSSSFSISTRSSGLAFTTTKELLLRSATTRTRPGAGGVWVAPPNPPNRASGLNPPCPRFPPCCCCCGPLKISVSSRAASSADTDRSRITLNRFSSAFAPSVVMYRASCERTSSAFVSSLWMRSFPPVTVMMIGLSSFFSGSLICAEIRKSRPGSWSRVPRVGGFVGAGCRGAGSPPGGSPPAGGRSTGGFGLSGSLMMTLLPIPSIARPSSSATTAALVFPPRVMVREVGASPGGTASTLPRLVSPRSRSVFLASAIWAAVPLIRSPGVTPVFWGSILGPPVAGKSFTNEAAASPGSSTLSAMNTVSWAVPPGWSRPRYFSTSL